MSRIEVNDEWITATIDRLSERAKFEIVNHGTRQYLKGIDKDAERELVGLGLLEFDGGLVLTTMGEQVRRKMLDVNSVSRELGGHPVYG